jgi:hypothetical protein
MGTSPTLVLDALVGAIINHVMTAYGSPPPTSALIESRKSQYLEQLVDFVLAAAQGSKGR